MFLLWQQADVNLYCCLFYLKYIPLHYGQRKRNIIQTLASIGQKVYSQSDFKSLMINMIANGITERVEANDQQRRNI